MSAVAERTTPSVPDARGRFGTYGGRYVPEVLIPALDELAAAWSELRDDPGFRDGARRPAPGLRRAPDPDHARAPPLRGARVRHLAEARGSGAHRRPQDQQRARAGAAREAAGQGADHRGDRRGTTRGRRRHGLRAARPPVRRVHGRGGHPPAGAERRADEAARRRGRPGHGRHAHAQGGRERGAARLGRQRAQHALHHRLGRRPAPVPGARARPAARDRRRGARAVRGAARRRPRRRRGLRGRRQQRDRDVHGLRRRARASG